METANSGSIRDRWWARAEEQNGDGYVNVLEMHYINKRFAFAGKYR
jgi:hypothetical protein